MPSLRVCSTRSVVHILLAEAGTSGTLAITDGSGTAVGYDRLKVGLIAFMVGSIFMFDVRLT